MGARGAAARIVAAGVLTYGTSFVVEMNQETATLAGMATAAALEPELRHAMTQLASTSVQATAAFAAETTRVAIDIAACAAERPRISRVIVSSDGEPSTQNFAYAFQGARGLAKGRFA
ncbi:hypothetical protein ACTZWW_03370 [Salinarimonas sp. NSM]|uniref:hypothetical protein n=1 Tax=Salinarimonas sp. NSM TaxID=3458003 RepID=UPI004036340F